VLLLANGPMVEIAEKAAASLEQRGHSCGVVNARWVKPHDDRLHEWVGAANHVVTLEDNVVTGGFGASVLEALSGSGLGGKVTTMGVPDQFLHFGSADDIRSSVALDVDSIIDRVAVILE
ncbi:MAG: 1-deoxy-D-xylulose-5-phosphate synthase, partial [Acidimicrobiia bacterium]|nr:1-deoxy-D-xylulose-5-phosphate synthase [Acidimicrobiia bacterium]